MGILSLVGSQNRHKAILRALSITVSSNGATTLAFLAVAPEARCKFVLCLALCLCGIRGVCAACSGHAASGGPATEVPNSLPAVRSYLDMVGTACAGSEIVFALEEDIVIVVEEGKSTGVTATGAFQAEGGRVCEDELDVILAGYGSGRHGGKGKERHNIHFVVFCLVGEKAK